MTTTGSILRRSAAVVVFTSLALPVSAQPTADPAPTDVSEATAEATDAAAGMGGSEDAFPPWLQRERTLSLRQLGLTADLRRRATRAELDLSFQARTDALLNGGRLTLRFDGAETSLDEISHLEVALNGETIAKIPRSALRKREEEREIALAAELLAAKNVLTLRLVHEGEERSCAMVPAGSWKVLRQGSLILRSRKLPLARDLSLLPLPFVDPKHDRRTTVDIAFAKAPTLGQLSAATSIAAYLGLHGAVKVAFRVHVGKLPRNDVVVLLDRPGQAASLGLPASPHSQVALLQHPRDRENLTALVLSGHNTEALQRLARGFALHARRLTGSSAALTTLKGFTQTEPPARHWVRHQGKTPFSKIVGASRLTHRGSRERAIAVRFRAAPDLFIWPGEPVTLDLRYQADYPASGRAPRVAFEFNHTFIESLPIPPRGVTQSARLTVPRELLRGYNEMHFHVSYRDPDHSADADAYACVAGSSDIDAAFTILGGSTVELRTSRRFRELPDLNLFLYDGYPFTRSGSLKETVAVLPDRPLPREIGTLLSIVAHLATVTGRAGTDIELRPAAAVLAESSLDKDLLLVGLVQRHSLLQQWQRRNPLRVSGGRLAFNATSPVRRIEQLLLGQGRSKERARLDRRLRDRGVAAVVSFRSPLHRERSVVAVTSATASRMPAMGQLQGYAESRYPNADVLLRTDRGRFLYRVGSTYVVGKVDPLTSARWSLSQHWLLMLGLLFLAACLFSWAVQRFLADRAQRRLVSDLGR